MVAVLHGGCPVPVKSTYALVLRFDRRVRRLSMHRGHVGEGFPSPVC